MKTKPERRTCPECGKTFTVKSRGKHQKYDTAACRNRAFIATHPRVAIEEAAK